MFRRPAFRHLFQRFYLLLLVCLLGYAAVAMGLRHSALSLHFDQWLLLFLLLALLISIAAYPVARRLTMRLARLKTAVAAFGRGDLGNRAAVEGQDEIAALAQGFNDAAVRIEALVAAHRRLLAHASHELRTPLTRLRLGIELLGEQVDSVRRAELNRDLAELDDLLEEILLASRLEALGETSRFDEECDLLAVVAEEVAHYPEAQLAFAASLRDLPCIRGDARLLRRLVRNLLENARRHGAPPVQVQIARDLALVRLRVTDAGAGVPAEDRERVFEPFYRGREAQENVGYGLGLSLVRQIAERHGGTVECLADADSISAFVVRLPLERYDLQAGNGGFPFPPV